VEESDLERKTLMMRPSYKCLTLLEHPLSERWDIKAKKCRYAVEKRNGRKPRSSRELIIPLLPPLLQEQKMTLFETVKGYMSLRERLSVEEEKKPTTCSQKLP